MEEQVEEAVQVGLFDVTDYNIVGTPSEDTYQDVALNAIGKIPLQDLINDAVSALVEVYKAKPAIFQLDVDNYENYPPLIANPLIDLVSYLREVHRETGTSNGAE